MHAEDTSTALAVYEGNSAPAALDMVRPLVNPVTAKAAIREYEQLKAAIVIDSDIQKIQGRTFLKKAFWRRVATCFGLSLEMVSEQRGFDEGGHLFYSVIYRAIAPNGRTMTADGYCSTAEAGRQGWPEHNVRATAHTRAKNRAISDLVGGGEVSAEEMPDDDDAPRHAQTRPAPSQATRTAPAPARATVKPAPVQPTPADEGEPPWVDMRARIRAVGMTDRRDVDRLCEQVGVKGGWDAASTWDHYHRIDKRITALETAKAHAEAKLTPAAPAPAPAENDASDADFPPDANDPASDVPGARDLRALPKGAMPS